MTTKFIHESVGIETLCFIFPKGTILNDQLEGTVSIIFDSFVSKSEIVIVYNPSSYLTIIV
jgi:hypothetical protein